MARKSKRRRQAVALLCVNVFGEVFAECHPVRRPDGESCQESIASSMKLDEFLAEADERRLEIPAGTPVIRLDLVTHDQAYAFIRNGPLSDARLPAGHIARTFEEPRRWCGESWDVVGPLTSVAVDVYCDLARQAGIPVQHTP